jgi:hypothetical protein
MKKKLGIFGFAAIALAMFFNINLTNKSVYSSDVDLGRLMLIQNAQAEYSCNISTPCPGGGSVGCSGDHSCSRWLNVSVTCDDHTTYC